jgi:hypothetical protein
MMKLASMKMDPKAREEMMTPSSALEDGPIYPYGLTLQLDDDTLDKLDLELPKVGEKLMVMAHVEVTSVSSNASRDGGKTRKHRSASLQITDLAIGPHEKATDAAEKLYDGKGKG